MSSTPQTIKHNNRSKNRDFNLYTEEFFGGSDVFIYIDGKRDHKIAAIQYTVQEQHKPIYGYGSRTFDDLAVGNRIVVGSLRIPVQNPEQSSFSNTWGVANASRERASRVTVPQWVYNYTPEKSNNTVVVENEDSDTFSMVARVQERLGLDVTGFINEDTRKTINSYRKNNGMMLGTLIDNELISNLGIEDYNCYPIRRSNVYDSPSLDNAIFTVRADEKLVFIASEGDVAMVRNESGKAGYISMEGIYRA